MRRESWGLGIFFVVSFPFLVVGYAFCGDIDFNRAETNLYKEELDSLSLAAFEEILINDTRLNYIENSKAEDADSIYYIDVDIQYTFIENNEQWISGRRDKPQLVADWTIYSPSDEKIAHLRTSNRLLVNERNVVHPRRTEFRNVYTELAFQSAESFVALLNDEEDIHVPSSPLSIRAKSDANVVASEYIGRVPFFADSKEHYNFFLMGLSRNQYLVNINRGSTAGFAAGKEYQVLIQADLNDPLYDVYQDLYYDIGSFESLLVDEDMSMGIIRLKRRYSQSTDHIFTDEIVRGYSFYPSGSMRPELFPKRN